MNFDPFGTSFGLFGTVGLLIGLGLSVFWMVVGWRAMKAHEQIADAADRLARSLRDRDSGK